MEMYLLLKKGDVPACHVSCQGSTLDLNASKISILPTSWSDEWQKKFKKRQLVRKMSRSLSMDRSSKLGVQKSCLNQCLNPQPRNTQAPRSTPFHCGACHAKKGVNYTLHLRDKNHPVSMVYSHLCFYTPPAFPTTVGWLMVPVVLNITVPSLKLTVLRPWK